MTGDAVDFAQQRAGLSGRVWIYWRRTRLLLPIRYRDSQCDREQSDKGGTQIQYQCLLFLSVPAIVRNQISVFAYEQECCVSGFETACEGLAAAYIRKTHTLCRRLGGKHIQRGVRQLRWAEQNARLLNRGGIRVLDSGRLDCKLIGGRDCSGWRKMALLLTVWGLIMRGWRFIWRI